MNMFLQEAAPVSPRAERLLEHGPFSKIFSARRGGIGWFEVRMSGMSWQLLKTQASYAGHSR